MFTNFITPPSGRDSTIGRRAGQSRQAPASRDCPLGEDRWAGFHRSHQSSRHPSESFRRIPQDRNLKNILPICIHSSPGSRIQVHENPLSQSGGINESVSRDDPSMSGGEYEKRFYRRMA